MVNAQRIIRQEQYKVLDVISELAPREHRRTANPRSRYMMSCPLPDHDDSQHRDRGGSFSVNEDETLWLCFGCGAKGNAKQLHDLLSGEMRGPYVRPPRQQPAQTPAPARKNVRKRLQGTTIAQLAEAKHLNPDYLYEELGWRDVKYFGTSAISIPYTSETNSDVQVRFRVGLDDGDRFRWDRGANPRMYGLWNLDYIKERNSVILVEGETDYATLDYHGFPVLGIPGITLAHDVIIHVGKITKKGFFAGTERTLDKLHHPHLHAMPQSPGQHTEPGTALAFAGAGKHQKDALVLVRIGNALMHDLLFLFHPPGMTLRTFRIRFHTVFHFVFFVFFAINYSLLTINSSPRSSRPHHATLQSLLQCHKPAQTPCP